MYGTVLPDGKGPAELAVFVLGDVGAVLLAAGPAVDRAAFVEQDHMDGQAAFRGFVLSDAEGYPASGFAFAYTCVVSMDSCPRKSRM